jgi:hypothetical protein
MVSQKEGRPKYGISKTNTHNPALVLCDSDVFSPPQDFSSLLLHFPSFCAPSTCPQGWRPWPIPSWVWIISICSFQGADKQPSHRMRVVCGNAKGACSVCEPTCTCMYAVWPLAVHVLVAAAVHVGNGVLGGMCRYGFSQFAVLYVSLSQQSFEHTDYSPSRPDCLFVTPTLVFHHHKMHVFYANRQSAALQGLITSGRRL